MVGEDIGEDIREGTQKVEVGKGVCVLTDENFGENKAGGGGGGWRWRRERGWSEN